MSDQAVADAYLATIRVRLDQVGFVRQVERAVTDLWRANVDRYEPAALYDDAGTLGFTASRNVSNRLYAELIGPQGQLAPNVTAVRDQQSVVFRVDDISVRIVKAPVSRGRRLDLRRDFRWEDREGRLEAAQRNAHHYRMPASVPGHVPLFDLPDPDAVDRISRCHEVFVVWAGDRQARTAAWIGLPTTGPATWFATDLLWWDHEDTTTDTAEPATPPPHFTDADGPTPRITLKQQRGIAGA